jgi:hypothetical protein
VQASRVIPLRHEDVPPSPVPAPTQDSSEDKPELNLRILWSLARYVSDRFGPPALEPRALLHDHAIDLDFRLVGHELGRLLGAEPTGFDPLNALIDDPVEVAEARMVRQELGKFEQLG